ncbi:MAG TPA: hypothetical protein VLM76_09530 [Patescibacteria group bacterium]|nr:hypothetical protein [Patescibacteria group bacterium]
MTAIWAKADGAWRTLVPGGFPLEADLHTLVEDAPELLPLAGGPRLTIVGREVPIGPGYADLIAVEPDGRIAIIEVKLAKNGEARRAVVAQILSYAAFLRGTERESFERDLVGPYLEAKGWPSLAEAVRAATQDTAFDPDAFSTGVERSLALGAFRLVLVLDDAPAELVRLVGYLETIGENLVIDLVTVASYAVGDQRLLVPQRIEPGHQVAAFLAAKPAAGTALLADSGAAFAKAANGAPADRQPLLAILLTWARKLEEEGLIRLSSYRGKNQTFLLPRLQPEQVGLVSIWQTGTVSLWRSVFERRAPTYVEQVEALTGSTMGAGTNAGPITPELLALLTQAYRAANESGRR